MSKVKKEEIIAATLSLASEYGIGRVSMNMIADKTGIKKPSLYNHFASKEALIEEAYLFLRNKAKTITKIPTDLEKTLSDKTAYEILSNAVNSYIRMNEQKDIRTFYKVIYSERCFNKTAAKILAEETERMIDATTHLLSELNSKNILRFSDVETSATEFALTVHGITDYGEDKNFTENDNYEKRNETLKKYIECFCKEHFVKEN